MWTFSIAGTEFCKIACVLLPQADSIAAAAQGVGDGQGMARQRNPISVSSGFVPAPAGQSLAAPQRPLQPLTNIEGVHVLRDLQACRQLSGPDICCCSVSEGCAGCELLDQAARCGPRSTAPGVPEPVLGHLGAMQDDIRRVSAFLGLTPTCVELAAAGQAPAQQPAAPGAPPRQEQQPWGSAPPPREPPPVQNLGEHWT